VRIHHVNLVTPPGTVEEVARFWVEVFGLRPIERQGRSGRPGAWLAGDEVEIHLSEREGAIHPDQHVAVVVGDVPAVRAAALEWGAPWEEATPVDGDHRGFTRDPAGNRIEVMG
jgi:catechol 2,3-dioxygenase-like lactoylglutathione lyase family enzyme